MEICTKCNILKHITNFYYNGGKKQRQCKECRRGYAKEHYRKKKPKQSDV